MTERKAPKVVRNSAAREVDLEEVKDLQTLLMHVDGLGSIFYPSEESDQRTPVRLRNSDDVLPVPPERFWHWYGSHEKQYLNSGKSQAATYKAAAARHGFSFEPGTRVLDFGCSGGRLIRHFHHEARAGAHIWGCDIDAAAMDWCQKNMMPPFSFFTNTTAPSLPFRDGFFDLIYALSVFTHIKDTATAWLLELSRCLTKNGLAIISYVDEHSLDGLRALVETRGSAAPKGAQYIVQNDITPELLKERGFITRESSPWWLGTLYSSEFFVRRASAMFDVIETIPNFAGFQTGMVLRNRG